MKQAIWASSPAADRGPLNDVLMRLYVRTHRKPDWIGSIFSQASATTVETVVKRTHFMGDIGIPAGYPSVGFHPQSNLTHTHQAIQVVLKADNSAVSNVLVSWPCVRRTAPPRCSEGRQMTSVPNMPGVFSVLLGISIAGRRTNGVSDVLFMRLKHGTLLV